MNNFIKGFATVIACGIFVLGCSANNAEATKMFELTPVEVSDSVYRTVDCRTGVVIYRSGSGISTQKLDTDKRANFGCAI